MKNFHTHTERCGHAHGRDEKYVEKAVKSGFSTLGFSDHSPMVFPTDHKSTFRVPLDRTEDYVNSISSLREKYKNEIKIYIGYEMEYYPECFDGTISFLEQYGFDYLIMGQHFISNEYDGKAVYCARENSDAYAFDCYIEQALTGLQTGKFLYIAHPDIFRYTGSDDEYCKRAEYFIKELKKLGIPLEFNLLGFSDKRNYPDRRFWEIAAKEGNDTVIGLDAHDPKVLTDMKTYNRALDYLHSLGIEPINDKVEIK